MGPTVHIPETERRRRQGGAATARVGRNGDAARSPRVRALSYRGSTGLNGYGLGSAGVLGLARSVPLFLDTSSAEAGHAPSSQTAPMRSTRPIPRCLVPSVNSPTWQRWPDTVGRAAACLALGSGRWPPEKPYEHEKWLAATEHNSYDISIVYTRP